jgi:hypothetical protein
LRRWYSEGVSRHNLKGDIEVEAAVKLLGNEGEYREILSSRDTARR